MTRNYSLYVTLGLADADVVALRAERARMPPMHSMSRNYIGISFVAPVEDRSEERR